jgi:hypothetical protein
VLPGAMQSRKVRGTGDVVWMGEVRNRYRVLVRKPEEKRPLGKRARRKDDKIKWTFRRFRKFLKGNH